MPDSPDNLSHKHSPEITNSSIEQGIAYIGFAIFLTGPAVFLQQEVGPEVAQYMTLGIFLILSAGIMAAVTGPTTYKLLAAVDEKLSDAYQRLV